MVQETPAFSEWQRVENRGDKSLRDVEVGGRIVARPAARVGRHEIIAGAADGAAVVQRPGERVADQGCQAGSEPLGQLGAHSVVVPNSVRSEELYPGGGEFRIG